jgi:hypothetical protein
MPASLVTDVFGVLDGVDMEAMKCSVSIVGGNESLDSPSIEEILEVRFEHAWN